MSRSAAPSAEPGIWLGAEAGSRLEVATKPRIGERVAILIDGRAALAPRITSPVGRSVRLSFGEGCGEVIEVGQRLAP